MEKAIIYHTDLDIEKASLDDLDVLDETEFVSQNLARLGYEVHTLPFSLDFSQGTYNESRVIEELETIQPRFVFNLVEAVQGSDTKAYLAPVVFERQDIRYTGCTKDAFFLTASKVNAKKILEANGIATPYYLTQKNYDLAVIEGRKFLVKSSTEHASKGLEERLFETQEELKKAFQEKGHDFFAEEYIDGREFNVSCIGSIGKGFVLPVAEMQFKDWKQDKLKIVGYNAKWYDESDESQKTERSFEFPESDRRLIDEIRGITKKCWSLFRLRGYARVDFRVSKEGLPYVLEINANPCISPDAGFIAAAERAGFSHEEIICNIIQNVC